MAELKLARELAELLAKPYPNDTPVYRVARMALLEEEIELRRQCLKQILIEERALLKRKPNERS